MNNYTNNNTLDNNDNITIDYINGLGDSNYENPDIDFSSVGSEIEVPTIDTNDIRDYKSDIDIDFESIPNVEPTPTEVSQEVIENTPYNQEIELNNQEDALNTVDLNKEEEVLNPIDLNNQVIDFNQLEEEKTVDVANEAPIKEPEVVEISTSDNSQPVQTNEDVKKENISTNGSVDIDSLFTKINSNVKEASDIFSKNAEIKKRIDERFNELKAIQGRIEKDKKEEFEQINSYKDSVIKELNEKKQEVENRIKELKDFQAKLESDKKEFEDYKSEETTKLQDLERQKQFDYDERKEELTNLETKLRKQKDSLDEERRQLSLDRIQYESDKNELANNLLKFNELVDTFTNGMNVFNGTDENS